MCLFNLFQAATTILTNNNFSILTPNNTILTPDNRLLAIAQLPQTVKTTPVRAQINAYASVILK